MLIGDILVEQRKLQHRDLMRALADQPGLGERLCSILIERGELEFDDAARALGEQRGVPAALERHLDGRDRALAALLPSSLARASCALPIGYTANGELIVCVRDPAPPLRAALQQATDRPVVLAITPLARLQALIDDAYGDGPDAAAADSPEAIEVDMTTGPIERPAELLADLAALDALDPASVRMSLTALDDDRVAKDPSQSGNMAAQGQPALRLPTAPTLPRVATQPTLPPRTTTAPAVRGALPKAAPTLDATLAALAGASERDGATDVALAFLAGRFLAALILAVRGRAAVTYRGHGASLPAPAAFQLALDAPSTVARAIATATTSIELPASAAQDQLVRALVNPSSPAAAPIVVDDRVIAVIATGDSIHGIGDADAAITELGQLAGALGVAWRRIMAR